MRQSSVSDAMNPALAALYQDWAAAGLLNGRLS
jgi:hypothetical protein